MELVLLNCYAFILFNSVTLGIFRQMVSISHTNNTVSFNFFLLLFRDLGVDDETNGSGVCFIYMSHWQQRILQLYGSEMCLIDCTYNTTIYGLPLLTVCVPTNVGFVTVATALLADETQETLSNALTKLAAWNPSWKPLFFMTDFSEAQIGAIEAVFPSM